MNILFFTSLLFCYLIYISQPQNKLLTLAIALILTPPASTAINFPVPTSGYRIIILFFIAHTIIRNNAISLPKKPLFFSSALSLFAILLVAFADSRLSLGTKLTRSIVTWIDGFAVLPFLFYWPQSLSAQIKSHRTLYKLTAALFAYALLVVAIQGNPITNFIASATGGTNFLERYQSYDSRFRSSSTFIHPMMYSYFSCIMLSVFFSYRERLISSRYHFAAIILMCFFATIVANSRLPIFTAILSVFALVYFSKGINPMKKIGLTACLIVGILISATVSDTIQSALLLFTSQGDIAGGSSLTLRQTQLQATIELFSNKPFFGHGINYIVENLGLTMAEIEQGMVSEFAAFESILFVYLVEQGLLGTISIFLIFGNIFYTAISIQNRVNYPAAVMTGTYVILVFGSGPLSTIPLFCVLFSICMAPLSEPGKLSK